MRIWFKLWRDNHMLRDFVYEEFSEESRTHKVFNSIEAVSYEFDIPKPIWLEKPVRDFKKSAKARFNTDCFIEEVEFDYLEMQVLEEDY